jgi:UDP-N-acetylmuramoyl-L-alanyl-D-glutamate--2,6-diaminopimelate ligase
VSWCGDVETGAKYVQPLRDLAPAADLLGPMPYRVLQSMFDAFAPPGWRNYWRGEHLAGLPDEAIARGVDALPGVPGRLEPVAEGQPFAVFVDYSHKPDALEAVLRTARELATGRVICVFGAGGDRDRGKRPLMGRIATELADVPIVTSDNPRGEDPLAIIDEVLTGAVREPEVEPDRRTAIARAIALAGEGDVVVIAGKGHEQGQEIAGRKLPFDDREVAREELRRLGVTA